MMWISIFASIVCVPYGYFDNLHRLIVDTPVNYLLRCTLLSGPRQRLTFKCMGNSTSKSVHSSGLYYLQPLIGFILGGRFFERADQFDICFGRSFNIRRRFQSPSVARHLK